MAAAGGLNLAVVNQVQLVTGAFVSIGTDFGAIAEAERLPGLAAIDQTGHIGRTDHAVAGIEFIGEHIRLDRTLVVFGSLEGGVLDVVSPHFVDVAAVGVFINTGQAVPGHAGTVDTAGHRIQNTAAYANLIFPFAGFVPFKLISCSHNSFLLLLVVDGKWIVKKIVADILPSGSAAAEFLSHGFPYFVVFIL